jgi:hypothetical protein
MTENMKKHQRDVKLLQYRMPHTGRIYNQPESCDNTMVYICHCIAQIILHADTLLILTRPERLKVAVTQYKQRLKVAVTQYKQRLKVAVTQYKQRQEQHNEKQPNAG